MPFLTHSALIYPLSLPPVLHPVTLASMRVLEMVPVYLADRYFCYLPGWQGDPHENLSSCCTRPVVPRFPLPPGPQGQPSGTVRRWTHKGITEGIPALSRRQPVRSKDACLHRHPFHRLFFSWIGSHSSHVMWGLSPFPRDQMH